MKVNIATCGIFHQGKYLRHLHAKGRLNRLYYAHKTSTNGAALGVPQEYLVHGHLKLIGSLGTKQMFPLYHKIWDYLCMRYWKPADLLHVVLHGTAPRLIELAKQDGVPIIAEILNAYPTIQNQILSDEIYKRTGQKSLPLVPQQHNIMRESATCDYFFAPSQFMADTFVDAGFDRRRIMVIPLGVDIERFPPPPTDFQRSDDHFRVLCIGSVTFRKGQLYLLEAWRRLKLKNAELVIIGAIHDSIRPLIEAYRGEFTQITHVPNHILYEYYWNSDLFILPSLEDGFSYVCAEAMACGLPVITTCNTGASEVITDGEEGFVVPIMSEEALEEKIIWFYERRGDQSVKAMGRKALNTAMETLSWEVYVDRLCKAYDTVMKLESTP